MQSAVGILSRDLRLGLRMLSVRNGSTSSGYVTQTFYTDMYQKSPRERAIAIRSDMDSLPKPFGNWQTEYNARQTKYNIHVLLSTLAVAVTSYLLYQADLTAYPDVNAPLNLEEIYQRRLNNGEE